MGNAISHGIANDENVIVQVTYDKAGRRVALRDPRGKQTTYTYDQLDRRISLSNPLDQMWTTAYSDLSGGRRRVTRTNPLGQQVEEDYDRLGRLVAVRYLNETPKHTPDVVFRYDAAGNRVTMDETLDGGLTWLRKTQYGYDGVGRLVSVGFDTNGDGVVEQTVTYQYDASGRRTQMTLPGNRTVQYAYDVKGQLVSLTDWDGQVTRYRYDQAGRLREAQGANLLTRRWRYDAAGRLRGLRHSREGKTLGDFAYEVDRRGNRTQVRECLPQAAVGTTVLAHSSAAIDYVRGTWAAAGDFHETTTMGAALRTEVFGTELTLVMGTGPDHSVYDLYLNGTLRDSLDGYAATPGERSLSYSLTDEGPHTVEVRNRTDKNLVSSGYKLRFKRLETNRRYDLHTIQYNYDKLERLRAADYHPAANPSAAPFRQHGYAYDVAGNRTQVNDNGTITNYTYNAANQIANAGFSYDAAGRMTSEGANTYTWDRADRLLSMGGVQNAYNGLGQRVQQSVGAQVTQYLLDTQPGLWQVLAATTGTDTTHYVHGSTGIQQQQNPDNAWLYPMQDALGSVRSVVDANMAVLESRQYEPYGEPWGVTGAQQTDFGFTGEPTDENGLVYLRARHYSRALGVFPSLDPLEGEMGRAMSLNRYGFVEANPANATDPSGRFSWDPPLDIYTQQFHGGIIEKDDCLYCVGREAGQPEEGLEYFTWVVSMLPANREALTVGRPDGVRNWLLNGGYLIVPNDVISGNGGKRCPCTLATPTPVPWPTLPIPTFDPIRERTPVPTCTATSIPTPVECNSYLDRIRSIGFNVLSGSAYVLLGGGVNLTAMWDYQAILKGDFSQYVILLGGEAGVGMSLGLDLRYIRLLSQGAPGLRDLWSRVGSEIQGLIVSEATLDELEGAALNATLNLFVATVGAGTTLGDCPLVSGQGYLPSGRFGAQLSISLTDTVYDNRIQTWWP